VSDRPIAAATAEGCAALASVSRLDHDGGFSVISPAVDSITSLEPVAQAAYQVTQTVATYVNPLAQALSSLERNVAIVDGIAEARCGRIRRAFVYSADTLFSPSY
jgi:hypothetical protein